MYKFTTLKKIYKKYRSKIVIGIFILYKYEILIK